MKSGYTQKIWDDPVWSKIISAGIIPVIGVIWFYLKSWWPFSRYKSQTSPVPVSKVFIREKSGFDHGAGHPLLFMDDAKAPNCLKNNGLKDLGNYSEWPKVAGAVIKARNLLWNCTIIFKIFPPYKAKPLLKIPI
jgi:hypothetical protein